LNSPAGHGILINSAATKVQKRCPGSAPAPGAVFRALAENLGASGALKPSHRMARNQRASSVATLKLKNLQRVEGRPISVMPRQPCSGGVQPGKLGYNNLKQTQKPPGWPVGRCVWPPNQKLIIEQAHPVKNSLTSTQKIKAAIPTRQSPRRSKPGWSGLFFPHAIILI
jgi:hypothetical protein